MTTNTTAIVDIDKSIQEKPDGFHCYDATGKKHIAGPFPTKVQAQRRLRSLNETKDKEEEEGKSDKPKDSEEDDVKKWVDDLRKQYNPSQPRDKRGRWTSGGVGAAASAAGRAVRSKVNVANAKAVGRGAMRISKPIIKTIGKAAFAGAMAGLVMGVENTFSSAGNDVGKAAGAAAAAAAKDLQRRAEDKAGLFVTAKVKKTGGGGGSVRVQGAQRVAPSASSYDLSRTAPGSGGFGSSGGSQGAVSVSPFMIHNTNMMKDDVDKEDEDGDEVWVVMSLADFDEDAFADAVQREAGRILKREAFFGTM